MGILDISLKLISDELKDYPDIEFRWFEKGLQFQVQFVNNANYSVVGKLDPDKENKYNDIRKQLGDRAVEVLRIIEGDGTITIKGIAERSDIPERTVKRLIKNLVDNGIIFREGSKKSGIWRTNGTLK